MISVFDTGSVSKNSDPGIGINIPDLSVADPRCLSRILFLSFPDPKIALKERGAKNIMSYLSFCSNKNY
jgi:hypothetical protein